ncbi:NAD(P)H-dependent D-xylose reductase (XR) [Apophysomyces sp. BC1034]|nr:NAD(P)H-dependent D-xylose reductase (XR) [Apophysomyces sp. BC1015]KAG0180942.1 NAD(P)H-dependent D-xylose reductase (XR) [Apophysomyces sp. BC1021]KAG0188513.1 NAD(P)H-dependent D-xylose reductase (XR) [Apophysomyces sp. BC1034]
MTIEYLTLQPSGNKMPMIGYGTWKLDPKDAPETIYNAIKVGYRLIDCASNYKNEGSVGKGIKMAIDTGIVKREELFITTKLWSTYHKKEHVRKALVKQLQDLGLDYVDMFLVHFPLPLKYVPIEEKYPPGWYQPGEEVITLDRAPMHECWAEMEKLVQAGLARNIGVSNFNVQLLMDMLTYAKIKPSLLQVELHPYLQQEHLVRWVQSQGIAVTAYSSFGPTSFVSTGSKRAKSVEPLFENPVVRDIAAKYNRPPSQVALRWSLERDVAVVPKSMNIDRMKMNLDSLNWKMDEEDVQAINQLDMGLRFNDPMVNAQKLPLFY